VRFYDLSFYKNVTFVSLLSTVGLICRISLVFIPEKYIKKNEAAL